MQETHFTKSNTSFLANILSRLKWEEIPQPENVYLQKSYKKCHWRWKIECFLPSSRTRRGYLFSPRQFSVVLEILANAIWQREDIKGICIGKVQVKLPYSLMTWSSTLKILRNLPDWKKKKKATWTNKWVCQVCEM